MTGPGPFDNDTATSFLRELQDNSASPSELLAVLAADSSFDLELSQEQYALAAIVVAMVERTGLGSVVTGVAAGLREEDDTSDLVPAAHDCLNRMLANPFAGIWRTQSDGGIAIKREARALRARLHRACSR